MWSLAYIAEVPELCVHFRMMSGHADATPHSVPLPDPDQVPLHEPVNVGTPCADCRRPLESAFFVRNGDGICPACREQMQGSFGAALAWGCAAALVSVALYYAILTLTGYSFVFIAVIAGVVIGGAVRKGAVASPLLRHRWLAVSLTYLSVVSTYTHALAQMEGVSSGLDAALRSLYLPLLMLIGTKNVVTLILLGFGLHEAWKFSAPPYTHVEGPFRVSAPDVQAS